MKSDKDSNPRASDEESQTRDPIVEELQDKDFSREEFLDAVSGAALARKGLEKLKEVAENKDEDHGGNHQDVVPGESFWDERYRAAGTLWSGHPNPQLVAEATDLVPGRALDVGCGEGADAIWLAEHGWQVMAVDISTVALARAAARTSEVGRNIVQRVTWLHADVTEWEPSSLQYDLVSAQFMHLPIESRNSLFRRLAAWAAPGGTFLIVGHHPSDLETTAMRPRMPDLLYTGDDVAALLDPQSWKILVNAARERGTTDPEGRPITIRDTVLRAQRHS